jgi:hypothetical protein
LTSSLRPRIFERVSGLRPRIFDLIFGLGPRIFDFKSDEKIREVSSMVSGRNERDDNNPRRGRAVDPVVALWAPLAGLAPYTSTC